ncbi:hypothetical protein HNQ59_001851 [Chitinivorax tropicus]|uniref:DUF2809 domain-containing protein n=1 Tax=Chitinivorax tropicus TaxID=714531 RepID=A0A840MP90_9PROT|nr:DUF2809 domain-containing protein [Chitinivorax tropicus]MBB5018562.1 hypothetical protein [Chitinivorax tropicus]
MPISGRAIYLLLALLVFLIEFAIAKGWIGGMFIRGSVGDILVIILIHCVFRGISQVSVSGAAITACALGFLVEGLQAIHLAELLGWPKGSVAYIVLGNTFSISDLAMYVIGAILAYTLDQTLLQKWLNPAQPSPISSSSTAQEHKP